MIKFQATYRITIYSNEVTIIIGAHEEKDENGNTVLVQEPARLSCQFNVTRAIMSDSNKATIQIKNLAPSTRERIFQDCFTLDPEKWKYIHLEAGYGDKLSMVFKGRILQAYSYKAGGQTDVITEIQAQNLDIFDTQSSHTFEAGTTFKEAVQRLASDFPNVTLANVGELEGTFKTRTTFDGNTLEQIDKLTGGHSYIDNGMLNILMNNEVLDIPVPVITDENGLLETPRRRDANLDVKMLFEPTLVVGQLLEIKSKIAPNFNGQYKVLGFTHDCLISGAEAGNRTTTVNLWIGPLLPGAIEALKENKGQSNFNKVEGFNISSINPRSPGKWLKPVKGSVTSPYGRRSRPIKGASTEHNALDIAVPVGTPVKAPADGSITRAAIFGGYGYCVDIYHGILNGVNVISRYAHLSRYCVSVGQTVKEGQIIAYSGGAKGMPGAGYSTGPHLHFEIQENGRPVNPTKYVGAF